VRIERIPALKERRALLTKLKKEVQAWMDVEARWFHKLGLTPNQVSTIGLFLALLSGLAYWQHSRSQLILIVAPLLLLFSGFCDALDGALARIYGKVTAFGGFLDSLLDRYADAFVFFGIILGGLCALSWGLVALTGSLLISYVRARAEATGVKMESVGIAERAERLLILAIASFISVVWLEALNWAVIILAVLTNLTVLQRAVHFYRRLGVRG
jgi:archaetidylinositol phosphate synthase